MTHGGWYPLWDRQVWIQEEDGALTQITAAPQNPQSLTPSALTDAAARQLAEYLAGERTAFSLPLAPKGTPFRQRVWRELLQIPYGETVSYGELARRLGKPGGARAVGQACRENPIWIVIPCHRVVGKNRSLTGYAGGLETKRRLLLLEAAAPREEPHAHHAPG